MEEAPEVSLWGNAAGLVSPDTSPLNTIGLCLIKSTTSTLLSDICASGHFHLESHLLLFKSLLRTAL
jgi:hypothetical protein